VQGSAIKQQCGNYYPRIRRQIETLDSATFVGMTDAGWREYDERQTRIHVLSEQLRLKPAA